MEEDLKVVIMDNIGFIRGRVSDAKQCHYCGEETVAYVWCKQHLLEMALIKRQIQQHASAE